MTKLITIALAASLTFAALPAQANCYADYKAKQDNPLKLSYGVIELADPACGSKRAAASEISSRIARDGWKLLTVISIFGKDGLKERKSSAGAYYLRY